MRSQRTILISTFAFAALVLGTQAVDAGFMATAVHAGCDSTGLTGSPSAGAASVGQDDGRERDPLVPPRRSFDQDQLLALGPSGSGGMTPTTTGGPSSGSAPAILADAADVRCELIAWLGPEGRVWLPPPFSSGVFRPPRVAC